MKAKIYILKNGQDYEVLTSSGLLYHVVRFGSAWSWRCVGRVGSGWIASGGARLLRSIPPVLKKDFFNYNKKVS